MAHTSSDDWEAWFYPCPKTTYYCHYTMVTKHFSSCMSMSFHHQSPPGMFLNRSEQKDLDDCLGWKSLPLGPRDFPGHPDVVSPPQCKPLPCWRAQGSTRGSLELTHNDDDTQTLNQKGLSEEQFRWGCPTKQNLSLGDLKRVNISMLFSHSYTHSLQRQDTFGTDNGGLLHAFQH